MGKLSKKEKDELHGRLETWQYVIGLTCPWCASNQIVIHPEDQGKLHEPKSRLACWDCGSDFTVSESRWYLEEWKRIRTVEPSDCAAEKKMAGDEAGGKGQHRAAQAPVLDIPANSMPLYKAVQSEDVPQTKDVKKRKKKNR